MTQLRLTEPARQDLQQLWLYIAQQGYVEYADTQLDKLLTGCELLCQQPNMGTTRNQIAEGLRLFPLDRYNIYYRYQDNSVYILHIVDAARDVRNIEF